MFNGVCHSLRLRRLQKERRRINKLIDNRLRDEKEYKDEDGIISGLTWRDTIEMDKVDEAINLLNSRWIIEQAERYDLPSPYFKQELGGDWQEARFSDPLILSRSARLELRSAIRKEQKERRELWQMKLVWVTALAGVIGTLTGLISALHR